MDLTYLLFIDKGLSQKINRHGIILPNSVQQSKTVSYTDTHTNAQTQT